MKNIITSIILLLIILPGNLAAQLTEPTTIILPDARPPSRAEHNDTSNQIRSEIADTVLAVMDSTMADVDTLKQIWFYAGGGGGNVTTTNLVGFHIAPYIPDTVTAYGDSSLIPFSKVKEVAGDSAQAAEARALAAAIEAIEDSLGRMVDTTRFKTDSLFFVGSIASKVDTTRFKTDSLAMITAINTKIDSAGAFSAAGDSAAAHAALVLAVLSDSVKAALISGLMTYLRVSPYPAADAGYTGPGVFADSAGENLTIGLPIRKLANRRWYISKANVDSLMPAQAVCCGSISAGAVGNMILLGWLRNDAWAWTAGGDIFVDTTGALTQTEPANSGNLKQFMGHAVNADVIHVSPNAITIEIK